MKKLLLTAGLLLLASGLNAQSFVVYAKGDFATLDASSQAPKPADPARAAFLAACQADLTHPAAFAAPLTLIPAPAPAWGKIIPGAGGVIKFHDAFRGGFIVNVTLEGLTPGHTYRLCLNGNPKLAGNDRLVDPVPGNPKERYYDFFTAMGDAQGRYRATFSIALPAGPYGVRFYVKDSADHLIFLYHDYFNFVVE